MTELQIPGWDFVRHGKVREVYSSGDRILLVASDRLSAFDCVLPDEIPGKGKLMTALSAFWFQKLDFVPSHFISADFAAFPPEMKPFAAELEGRATLVRRTQPLPVTCVVRGYLAAEAWDEYRVHGTVGGHELPRGLREASKLPAPIFSAVAISADGTEEMVTWDQCRRLLGDELAHQVREESFEVYDHGRAHAERAGVIIADARLEFGLIDGDLVLIDELLTPDSSRFWPAVEWEPGKHMPSFDKQFVRDYLAGSGWNLHPPAPHLPAEIIAQTAAKYREAYERLALMRYPA